MKVQLTYVFECRAVSFGPSSKIAVENMAEETE